MKFELDPRDPSMLEYDKHRNHVLNQCVDADALTIQDLDGARVAPGVSPYSIQAVVPLPQTPVVVNFLVIPRKETPVPAQATEGIPIPTVENTIQMKLDNMMKAFEAWMVQMGKVNTH